MKDNEISDLLLISFFVALLGALALSPALPKFKSIFTNITKTDEKIPTATTEPLKNSNGKDFQTDSPTKITTQTQTFSITGVQENEREYEREEDD